MEMTPEQITQLERLYPNPPRKTRVSVTVTWDLDPVPGWNHEPEHVIQWLERELERIAHYNPTVRLQKPDF